MTSRYAPRNHSSCVLMPRSGSDTLCAAMAMNGIASTQKATYSSTGRSSRRTRPESQTGYDVALR